jgi:hypothetical protein
MKVCGSFSRRWSGPLLGAVSLGAVACQAVFGDFEVGDEPGAVSQGGNAGQPTQSGGSGLVAPAACEAGDAPRCSGDRLEVCERGQWQLESQCQSPQHCDATAGRCLLCIDGETRCDGERSEQACEPESESWSASRSCAAGWLCDPEQGRCLRCAPGEGVCAGSGAVCLCAEDRLSWEPVNCAIACDNNGNFDACRNGETTGAGLPQLCENI